jgi:hypothetical protein
MARPAVCSDPPDSVHMDPAHGCFSRIYTPMLSLILNNVQLLELDVKMTFLQGNLDV